MTNISKRRGVLSSVVFAGFLIAGSALAASPALAAWDSIAVDDDTSTAAGNAGYGVGTGNSKGAAEAEAVKACKSEGNSNCKVAVSYQTCGAYASSTHKGGIGTGASKAAASNAALKGCGEGACKIVIAECVGDQ